MIWLCDSKAMLVPDKWKNKCKRKHLLASSLESGLVVNWEIRGMGEGGMQCSRVYLMPMTVQHVSV